MNTVTPVPVQDRKYVLSVGLDWADQKHAVCQRGGADGQRQVFEIGTDPASVQAWLAELKALAGTQGRVAIGFEQSRGALFEMLRAHTDWIDLYPLNPLTVSKFREALFTSGAKDDPLDSQLIEELLYHHLDRLRPYQAPEPELRELDLLCQQRRKAVDAAVACANELCSLLKVYYPLALDLHEELRCTLTLHFLKRWPTLEQLKKAKPQTLRSFYYQHHSRSQSLITERLEKITRAQAVTEDLALIRPSVLSLQRLVNQLLTLQTSIAAFDKAIQALFAQHPDHLIFESLPGAGPQLAPRLLAAFGSNRAALSHPSEMQKKSGTAPVLDRSGQGKTISRRWCRSKFLCQTFHEFAAHSIPHSTWAKACYQELLARGKSHNAAVRALAFKWIRIIFRLWQDRTLYDENRYLQTLKNRRSPLSQKILAPMFKT
jgi:transposase